VFGKEEEKRKEREEIMYATESGSRRRGRVE